MSKPISSAEMKDWVNETWLQCLTEAWNEGKRMNDRELFERALDALDSDNPDIQLRTAIALRERLAQPEQNKEDWQYVQKLNAFSYPRPWVGLTDEETDDAARYCVKSGHSVTAAIRGIEVKLKEKNT